MATHSSDGYAFIGWNTAQDGSGVDYAPGAKFTIYSNISLYAQWTPVTYTVRFHKNDGGEDVYTDQTLTYAHNSERIAITNKIKAI